jgi:hypothetical protein
VSDRARWLDECCPECWAAPAGRCRWERFSRKRAVPVRLHVARGWRVRRCPTCDAYPGELCRTPSGREASRPHAARLRPGVGELLSRQAVWDELERRGATIAAVLFSGRAGQGGRIATITLSRLEGDELVDVERWSRRDEPAYALEGPVWDRYGGFAGQPWVRGTVTWTVADRCVLIGGQRGGEAFEEVVL